MSDLNLGQIISDPSVQRDAVHIAVAPVVAAATLYPGARVALNPEGKAVMHPTGIGIVDPFLQSKVFAGERFWLWLTPGTITSLRHDWAHPAFTSVPAVSEEATAMSDSERWLREFAQAEADGLSYEDLLSAARAYDKHGEYLNHGPRFEGCWVPEEFWGHYEAVTGERVKDRGNFFSCSC